MKSNNSCIKPNENWFINKIPVIQLVNQKYTNKMHKKYINVDIKVHFERNKII